MSDSDKGKQPLNVTGEQSLQQGYAASTTTMVPSKVVDIQSTFVDYNKQPEALVDKSISRSSSSSLLSSDIEEAEKARSLLSTSRNILLSSPDQGPADFEPGFLPVDNAYLATGLKTSKPASVSSSTFSDLSETSISKSALEEAILQELDGALLSGRT